MNILELNTHSFICGSMADEEEKLQIGKLVKRRKDTEGTFRQILEIDSRSIKENFYE